MKVNDGYLHGSILRNRVKPYRGVTTDGKDIRQKDDSVQNPLASVLEILTRQDILATQKSASYTAGNAVIERSGLMGDEFTSWGGILTSWLSVWVGRDFNCCHSDVNR